MHNYGYPNEIYNSKTGNKSNKDERLEINTQYLEETLPLLKNILKKSLFTFLINILQIIQNSLLNNNINQIGLFFQFCVFIS